MRQYAQEKLSESAEAGAVRDRHRDHYTAMAAALDSPANSGMEVLLDQAETEIDNLRAAFAWSRRTPTPIAHCSSPLPCSRSG